MAWNEAPRFIRESTFRGRVWKKVRLAVIAIILTPGHSLGAVIITDSFDEGIPCFKIQTETATYYYDKQGAGFTSILDQDGVDWIGFHPKGTPNVRNGQSGWYRGVPNMGLNVFGHPGYTGAVSTTKDPLGTPLPKVTVDSTKDGWHVTWEVFPTFARMVVHRVPDSYWLLYEGTPGGALDANDVCWRANGTGTSCDEPWEGDIVDASSVGSGIEWVAFSDAALERSLFLIHDDDQITDHYFSMGAMTVFGFGRQRRQRPSLFDRLMRKLNLVQQEEPGLLRATPTTLLMGFVESGDFRTIRTEVETFRGLKRIQ